MSMYVYVIMCMYVYVYVCMCMYDDTWYGAFLATHFKGKVPLTINKSKQERFN